MPAAFDKCVREGGRVINKSLPGDKYIHICYDKDGNAHRGEVKKSKTTSEPMTKKQSLKKQPITMMIPLAGLSFKEGENKSEIQIMQLGKWEHPIYGTVEITEQMFDEFVDNFDRDVRAHSSSEGLPVDEEHRLADGAVGWIMKLMNRGDKGLFALVEWNERGKEAIENTIYKFFSPEFYTQYEDPETRRVFNNVLCGGALTNRPYFKGLTPVVLSEELIINDDDMDFNAIVKKNVADLSQEEKDLIKQRFSELDEEGKQKFQELDPNGEEGDNNDGDGTPQGNDKPEGDQPTGDGNGTGAGQVPVEGSEKGKTISMSESEVRKLQEQAAAGEKAMGEIRTMRTKEKVAGFIFSESNKSGKLPAKVQDKVVAFVETLNETQSEKFFEIVGELPAANLFGEKGESAYTGDGKGNRKPKDVGQYSYDLDQKAKSFMEQNKDLTYEDALVMAEEEIGPELEQE